MQQNYSTEKEIITSNREGINKSDNYNCRCKSTIYKTIKQENYKPYTIETITDTNSYDFLYISEGGGIYKTNNIAQEIKVGYFTIIKPNEKIEFTPSIGKQTSFFHISVSSVQYTLFLEKIDLFQKSHIANIGQNVIIENIFNNMIQLLKENKKGTQAVLNTSLLLALSIANYKFLNCHEKEDPTIEKINTAVEILSNDITAKISPEEVAERIGISYSLFRRIFKENMGTSPAQYQMDIRLKKAHELLTTTNYSIAKIAENLGFSDTAQFSTFFRKRQNMTPREYRNNNK